MSFYTMIDAELSSFDCFFDLASLITLTMLALLWSFFVRIDLLIHFLADVVVGMCVCLLV